MNLDESNKKIEEIFEHDVKLPIMKSFALNLIIFCLPIYPVILLFYLYPIIMKFFKLDTLFGLTPSKIIIQDFWLYIFSPVLFIFAIFVYIFLVGYLTYLIHHYFDKKSPQEQGVFVRKFSKNDVVDERIKYYNYRGFIIKYPLWLAQKSPFYWMMNWILRKVGLNNVHRDAHLTESFPPLNFYTAEKDTIMYPTSVSSSHMLDSIFGLLSNYKVVMNKGTVIYPQGGMGPNTVVNDETIIMPGTLLPKRWRNKTEDKVISGVPGRPCKYYQGIKSFLNEKEIQKFENEGYIDIESTKKLEDEYYKKINYDINNDLTDADKDFLEKNKKKPDSRLIMKNKIPLTTSSVPVDSYSVLLLIQFILALYIMISTNYCYIYYIFKGNYWLLLLLPPSIYMYFLEFTFSAALIAQIMVKILRKIHPPREGIFPLNSKEFKYYKMRYWSSVLPIWLARATPVPWVDMTVFRMLGIKMGKKVCIYDTWFDIDFIEIGDHVMTSLNTSIISHAIFHDKFIQLKCVMKRDSIAGAMGTICPGAIVDESAILGSVCSTYTGQHLIGAYNHLGNPVYRTLPIKSSPESEINLYKKVLKKTKNKNRKILLFHRRE
jgi:hypothetical protein